MTQYVYASSSRQFHLLVTFLTFKYFMTSNSRGKRNNPYSAGAAMN